MRFKLIIKKILQTNRMSSRYFNADKHFECNKLLGFRDKTTLEVDKFYRIVYLYTPL